MNDILISQLLPDYNFGGDGASGSRKYWFISGTAGRTARDSSGKPTYIVAGLCQRTQVLRIPQGETSATRIIGLKTGTNPDGSYQVKLLANNIGYLANGRKYYTYGLNSGTNNNSPSLVETDTYSAGLLNVPTPTTGSYSISGNNVYYGGSTSYNGTISSSDGRFLSNDSISELYNISTYATNSSVTQIESNGNFTGSSISNNLKITTDVNNTVQFGVHNLSEKYNLYSGGEVYIDPWFTVQSGKIDPMLGYTGKNYEYVCSMLTKIQGQANAQQTNSGLSNRYTMFVPNDSIHYTPTDFYFGTRYDNLHITSSYEKAIEYLNNGTIPDDDEYNERNPDNPNPYDGDPQPPTPPEPPESQVANEDNDIPEHTTRGEYNVATSNTLVGINWYYIHKSILEGFIDWFWNDISDWSSIVINWVTGLYGDLQNAIVSLKKINVAKKYLIGQSTNTTTIKLARYTCNRPTAGNYLQEINSELTQLQHAGGISFTESSDLYSFLNYSPYTQVSLYLPYVGVVPLETRYIRGATLNVACGCSFQTGEIIYRVQMGDCDVAYYQGKCSEDVPFSLNSAMELATNTVNAIGNVSAGLVTGGLSTASTMLLDQNISAPTNTNASVTSTLNKYLGSRCAIIIQRPQHYKLYDVAQGKTVADYGHVSGYKYNCIRTFSNGDGYVEFSNPHIDNWNTAPTDEETQEIYSLMQEGIVL